MTFLLSLLLAFLIGSIPWGFILCKLRGLDIRQHGSGNIGATNVGRVLGRNWGILAFALDFAKGALGAWGGAFLLTQLSRQSGTDNTLDVQDWQQVAFGVAAVLGHNFCPWLGFKGGKGIATSAGVLLVVFQPAFYWALGAWILGIVLVNIMSVGSCMAALALAISGCLLYGPWSAKGVACVLLGALAIWRHRSNLERLRAGTEPKWLKSKKTPLADASDKSAS